MIFSGIDQKLLPKATHQTSFNSSCKQSLPLLSFITSRIIVFFCQTPSGKKQPDELSKSVEFYEERGRYIDTFVFDEN